MDVSQVIAIVAVTSAVNLLIAVLVIRYDFKDEITGEDL
jgi:hypothetical protein